MPHDKLTNRIEPLKILLEKQFLNEMARTISEIQAINICIDDARTNGIARIRYRKFKPKLKELVWRHKKLTDRAMKEELLCTSH